MNKNEEIFKKVTKNIKDYIPNNIAQENIRDQTPMIFPLSSSKQYSPLLIPNLLFEEWPSDEIVNAFDFGLNSESKFTDSNNNLIIFPTSLRKEATTNLVWLRPIEMQIQKTLRTEIIQNFPNNNPNNIQKKLNSFRQPTIITKRNSIDVIVNSELYNQLNLNEGERKIIENLPSYNQYDFVIFDKETNKPSNIKMERYYCKFCKWLASLYQIIIDNSLDSNLFTKSIYPQIEGIPVYNKSGRYWVKLFHMGKYRKIEIDDFFPCDKNSYEPFLPQSVNNLELWPLLLSKALMKMYSYKYRNYNYEDEEIGDCSAIYSLCGYIGYEIDSNKIRNCISLSNIDDNDNNNNNNFLQEILDENNYVNKNKLLIAFTPSKQKKIYSNFSFKKFIPIENINNVLNNGLNYLKKDFSKEKISTTMRIHSLDIKRERNIFTTLSKDNPLLLRDKILNIPKKIVKVNKKLDIGVFLDTAYSIIEIFSSGNFNMKRLIPIVFSDLKLSFDKKYKQMNPEEKKNYLEKLKDLRHLQRQEKKKRKEEYFSKGENIILLKFTNSSIDNIEQNHKLYEIESKYNSEQIEMAKFCILNNKIFPTIEYFEGTFLQKIFKDEESGEINFWTKKFYKKKILEYYNNIIKNNLNEEGNNEQQKEAEVKEEKEDLIPIKRREGCWIEADKIKDIFNKFILLLNPKKFKNTLCIDNIWYDFDKDIFEEKDTSNLIKLSPDKEIEGNVSSSLYILFEPNGEKNCKSISSGLGLPHIIDYKTDNKFDDISYSISLQLFIINDKREIDKTDTNITLHKFFSLCELNTLKANEEYIIMIKGGTSPFGYTINLYSNTHSIDNYSYNKFLIEFKHYQQKKLNVSYPILQKKKYYLIMQTRISLLNNTINNNNNNNNKLSNFFVLFENFDDKNIKKNINLILINNKSNKKKPIAPKELFLLDFTQSDNYILEMSIFPPFDIPSNAFEFNILFSNQNISIEKIDMIQPFNITQLYLPNKHQIVFNELIFPTEYVISTLDISLEYKPNVESSMDKIPFEDDIKMKFELYEGESLIFSKEFINRTLVRNLVMTCNNSNDQKSQDKIYIPYCIKCSLCQGENPNYLINLYEYQSDFYWNICVFSSDPIFFVKNTIKYDRERKLIQSWELNQPGRAKKAKSSRHKYFIVKKKNSGEPLSNNEKEIIGERQNEIESQSEMILTNIPSIGVINNNNINMNKNALPKIHSYKSLFIRNFCAYSKGDRIHVLKVSESLPNIKIRCKSNEEQNKEKEKIVEDYENYCMLREYERKRNAEINKNIESEITDMTFKLSSKRKRLVLKNLSKVKEDMQKAIENIKKIDEVKELCIEICDNIDNNEVSEGDFDRYYDNFKKLLLLEKMNNEFKGKIKQIKRFLTKLKENIIIKALSGNDENKKDILMKHMEIINEKVLLINKDIINKLISQIKAF